MPLANRQWIGTTIRSYFPGVVTQIPKLRYLISLTLAGLGLFGHSRSDEPARHHAILDRHWSSTMGAHNLSAAHAGFGALEDRIIPLKLGREEGWVWNLGGFAYRLAKLSMFDILLPDYLGMLAQHEFFGHGYRMRELEFRDIEYSLWLPPPYGEGGGETSGFPLRTITLDESILVSLAGVQANLVLARQMERTWMLSGRMDYHQAGLYWQSFLDLYGYVNVSDEITPIAENSGNDIAGYLNKVNRRAGLDYLDEFALTRDDLQEKLRFELLNPFLWYALYTQFGVYAWSGEASWNFPAPRLGPLRFMPGIRVGLSPYGMEYHWDGYFTHERGLFHLYARKGGAHLEETWGGGARWTPVSSRSTKMGLAIDIWDQPGLLLGDPESEDKLIDERLESGLGGAAWLELWTPMFPPFSFFDFYGQAGYKTDGYLPGEPLQDGAVIRAGFAWTGWNWQHEDAILD